MGIAELLNVRGRIESAPGWVSELVLNLVSLSVTLGMTKTL